MDTLRYHAVVANRQLIHVVKRHPVRNADVAADLQIPGGPDLDGRIDVHVSAQPCAEQAEQEGTPDVQGARAWAEQKEPYPVPQLPGDSVPQGKGGLDCRVVSLDDHRRGTWSLCVHVVLWLFMRCGGVRRQDSREGRLRRES